MTLHDFIFGRLTFSALPQNDIALFGAITVIVGVLAVLGVISFLGRWKWLWKEYLTSLDAKRIGVLYLAVAGVMLARGGADALLLRAQQATSAGASQGIISATHFQEIFSAHGSIMVFFVAMGLMFGLINLVLPLQLGTREVAFPFLNSVSFWLFFAGAALINVSLIIGDFSTAGWLSYPPLSELAYSPTTGVDYWIWSLQIAGLGSLLSGVNFLATIVMKRARGMTPMRMPMFAWTVLIAMALVVFAFPVLTATLGMLALDRTLGMHFFTAGGGGNMMMYVNLIWAWGHPEVYILVLPAFGIYSEIVSVFSSKKLAGYTSMVLSIIAIGFLSWTVWLHHFFTMGAGADVNAFFGIMTAVIAVPTGVKIFNWIFTMYRGKIRFTTPMLWFMGFVVLFTIGGVAGVVLAEPPADYQLHNSLFLVAHFHTMIVSGVLFGYFAGLTYWFPKIFGFRLDEKWGRRAFWCWLVGFILAFVPLYILGFMGATRRLDHYSAALGWQPLFIVAGLGALLIAAGFACQLAQIVVSIRDRRLTRDATGDPWDGRTLEWSVPSPAPAYNFARLPLVSARDQFWVMKERGLAAVRDLRPYEDIWMPRGSAAGLIIGGFAFLMGFGIVWHLWWLAIIGLAGAAITAIARTFAEDTEEMLPAAEVARLDEARSRIDGDSAARCNGMMADMSTARAAPKETEAIASDATTLFGFWTYLMTDLVLFASLFAVYAVLRGGTFGGPGTGLFSLPFALEETLILLTSSFVCGLALLCARANRRGWTLTLLFATFALGASFLYLELSEFARFIRAGDGPSRSGFLSSYFTLVGTHGLHIALGLLWMLALIIAVAARGLTRSNVRKLALFSLFWHFLDLVWIFIFTIVYLFGL